MVTRDPASWPCAPSPAVMGLIPFHGSESQGPSSLPRWLKGTLLPRKSAQRRDLRIAHLEDLRCGQPREGALWGHGAVGTSFPEVPAGVRTFPRLQSLLFLPGCCSVLWGQSLGLGRGGGAEIPLSTYSPDGVMGAPGELG